MQSKKIFKILLYLLTFLNFFFLSTILSYRIAIRGEMVTLLAKKRLSLNLKDVRFDTQWARGRITHQNPSVGSKIKINKTVNVTLSAGSEKVIVPSLEGKTLNSASKILNDAGLRAGITSQAHSSDRAAGKIIAQQPPLLVKVARNTPVSLLVSQGESERKYLMPDLIGKKAAPVIAKLKRMDFRVGVVRYSYYPGLEPGIIIKQLPPHGFRIQKNNLITLEVSKE